MPSNACVDHDDVIAVLVREESFHQAAPPLVARVGQSVAVRVVDAHDAREENRIFSRALHAYVVGRAFDGGEDEMIVVAPRPYPSAAGFAYGQAAILGDVGGKWFFSVNRIVSEVPEVSIGHPLLICKRNARDLKQGFFSDSFRIIIVVSFPHEGDVVVDGVGC